MTNSQTRLTLKLEWRALSTSVLGLVFAASLVGCSALDALVGHGAANSARPMSAFSTPNNGNCFVTGGSRPLTVCHNTGDEGTFYQTPTNEVSYNAQVLKVDPSAYITVYHSESKDSWDRQVPRAGDSIRAGAQSGPFSYQMPATNWAIWGSTTDIYSANYYGIGYPNANAGGASGGGNPMVVVGNRAAGDPYYYMFFLTVTDGAAFQPADWRHHLSEARTLDFATWDLLTSDANGNKTWQPFTNATADWQRRPLALTDTSGAAIQSVFANDINNTQGLIGSMAYVNGVYYFFYADRNPANENEYFLYYRTTSDVSQGVWSPATQVSSVGMPIPVIMRIQKAKGMNRWSVVYGCYSPETNLSDICVQYTENLNVIGSGGLSDLVYFTDGAGHSNHYLGLGIAACNGSALRAQQYPMTDLNGNLETPNGQEAVTNAGFVTWMDMCSGDPYGAPMFRAGWQVSGDTSEGPATPAPKTPPKSTPPVTPPPPQSGGGNPMYRFVNGSGHHFYSSSPGEGSSSGYTQEFQLFAFVGGTSTAGTMPFYRCLGPSLFLSTHADCEGSTRADSFAYGSLYVTQGGKGQTPIYRLINKQTGERLMSTSSSEGASAGYVSEGIIGFAL